MSHLLVHPWRPAQDTTGMTGPAIRSMMDVYGYTFDPHEEGADVVPGVQPQLLQAPQASTQFMPTRVDLSGIMPGPSPFPGGTVTDWSTLIRTGIDLLFGRLGGGSGGLPAPLQGPLVLPPGSPTPGLFPPGGLQGPVGGGVAVGGRVPFITMPNGLPGCPSGYHPEKSGKPYCVRNRRMNPLNPRALSRATRRVKGFTNAVKRARTLKKVCRSL